MKNKALFVLFNFSFVLFTGDVEGGKSYKAKVHPKELVTASIVTWKENETSTAGACLEGILEELKDNSTTEVAPSRRLCDCSSAMSRISEKCKDCAKTVQINYSCFCLGCRIDTLWCCLRCCYK